MIGRVQFLDYDSTNPNAILPQCKFSGFTNPCCILFYKLLNSHPGRT